VSSIATYGVQTSSIGKYNQTLVSRSKLACQKYFSDASLRIYRLSVFRNAFQNVPMDQTKREMCHLKASQSQPGITREGFTRWREHEFYVWVCDGKQDSSLAKNHYFRFRMDSYVVWRAKLGFEKPTLWAQKLTKRNTSNVVRQNQNSLSWLYRKISLQENTAKWGNDLYLFCTKFLLAAYALRTKLNDRYISQTPGEEYCNYIRNNRLFHRQRWQSAKNCGFLSH